MGTGDLAAQVEQAYANVVTALAVVDWPPDKMATLGEGVGRVAAPGSYVPGPSPTARGSIRTVRRRRWRAWN